MPAGTSVCRGRSLRHLIFRPVDLSVGRPLATGDASRSAQLPDPDPDPDLTVNRGAGAAVGKSRAAISLPGSTKHLSLSD